MQVQDIVDEALKLDEEQRIRIAELLMASLGPPDPAIEQAWVNEAARRLKAYDEGRMPTYAIEDVLKDN